MAAPRIIDYGRIEPGWREGLLSVPQLAEEYEKATGQPVTRQAINKHFRELGIPRDLTAKIQAKADAMVAEAMVAGKVAVEENATTKPEAQIINSAATTVANVQLSHRADIRRFRARAAEYEAELDQCSGDELAKRSSILKNLSETLCKLIAAEREAFGMDKGSASDDIIETITRRVIRATE